jgi:CheY-like chemotaxis protein
MIIWVKVVGFRDVERHSLNTLFRLSARRSLSYALWTPEVPIPPQVALIDVDCYEAGLELASPSLNPNLKLICVGATPPGHAWHSFARPVDWNALVKLLDGLFAGDEGANLDIDINFDAPTEKNLPPGMRASLLVGMTRDERLYLRARLALAGVTEMDEADTATSASNYLSQRHYHLVVVSLELADADPWALVESLHSLTLLPPRSVIVTTRAPTWAAMERAEQAGCLGLLDIPFNPRQVMGLLQQV